MLYLGTLTPTTNPELPAVTPLKPLNFISASRERAYLPTWSASIKTKPVPVFFDMQTYSKMLNAIAKLNLMFCNPTAEESLSFKIWAIQFQWKYHTLHRTRILGVVLEYRFDTDTRTLQLQEMKDTDTEGILKLWVCLSHDTDTVFRSINTRILSCILILLLLCRIMHDGVDFLWCQHDW